MNFKMMIAGLLTYLPGVNHSMKGTGGTISARYCYSVWLRHLVMAEANGLNAFPKLVAELGPGDSLGIGLSALISGCNKYYAMDVVVHANNNNNLIVFDELVDLFKNRAPIPNEDEFPRVKPYLKSYAFPEHILTEERLQHALESSRLQRIRESICTSNAVDSLIRYKVPWDGENVIEHGTIDMVYSQAVLEHVNDLKKTYHSMSKWLNPLGFISHQIDLKSHGTSKDWNGHWKYSDLEWMLIKGKRPFLINRIPHSSHIELLQKEDFEIVCDQKIRSESNISQVNLSSKFKSISDSDLTTSGTFIQAVKIN